MNDDLRPIGFWSYHRPDGKSSDGRMARLYELLKQELYSRVAEPVEIFRDLEELRTGDAWERELNAALDRASFLVAVVTPGFLRSEWCTKEVKRFRDREQTLGRALIFPIEYSAFRRAVRNAPAILFICVNPCQNILVCFASESRITPAALPPAGTPPHRSAYRPPEIGTMTPVI